MENLTPMMRQYHRIKQEHPNVLLFFRLGDFYEMFYEDAVTGSRELEITLTSRNTDRKGNPIPMCGIPHHAVSSYVAKLLRKGYKVAICEQVEDPRAAKGIVRREVTRILTPGTAVEEGVLDTRENNFVAAVVRRDDRLGVAFMDVSTGEFAVSESPHDGADQVGQEFFRFQPSEIIFPQDDDDARRSASLSDSVAVFTPVDDWTFNLDFAERVLKEHFGVSGLEGLGFEDCPAAAAAAGALLQYVRKNHRSALSHVRSVRHLKPSRFLKMDDATIQNLELTRGLDGNKKWTLLSVLDSAQTGMGARLLKSWILRPSLDLEAIRERHNAVEELHASAVETGRLAKLLAKIHDLDRLLSRVTLQLASPRDLLALRESINGLPDIAARLEQYSCPLLSRPIDLLEDVGALLNRALADDAPIGLSEGGIIRDGYYEELDELRRISKSGKSFIAGLETKERELTGIPSLKVRYNRVFGYFIEVTKTHLKSVPDRYSRKQTLAGSERYVTEELKEYEEKVLGAEERIVQIEKEIFLEVRDKVGEVAGRIQSVSQQLGMVDVLVALAETARTNRYVRPMVDSTSQLTIRAGRHPVLERQGDEPFVPNDLEVNNSTDQMLILTGPNMGGKSTFLRQNALIVIMAQIGSFVPAAEARVGLVDRIFTRVGASDNLARGRSTFMVEMIETARILNTATPQSLVLLDEVGRGTATFDGLSIAWAVAEFLVKEPSRKARTLFATHYLELTQLEGLYEGVRNYCVTVRESGKDIIFFHRVMRGVANRSYGIEVARLAGIPFPVVERAREVLSRLERKQLNLAGGQPGGNAPTDAFPDLQRALF